ncbi:phytanoyl-CoA dioxygenase [Taibaiella sp. KBW10]|uniref:phytanoyl-CoA dioxygenase family protein n=1 Tax=Taibaiella sp. KBW10 TaxID=2153357 RepID=UPI000F599B28|nr:phytanoyl-CoA dioxygenase family protein [Taibaiella sp. KBW10]RQO29765.1 phytanoyl-CoA dioxygenase [Taibaiella sp. KBW10]
MCTDPRQQLVEQGFAIIDKCYDESALARIIEIIDKADQAKANFRNSGDLFAVRHFLMELPESIPHIFNGELKELIQQVSGKKQFVIKSIYFDKPERSNWYVPYHQDLKIEVDRKIEIGGFSHWTLKQGRFSVQPSLDILDNILTIRIHLDDTDAENGALKVIPRSHRKGIYRPETIDWQQEEEVICAVPKGGLMLMKPLLVHSSSRATNQKRRRVIHIECTDLGLPCGLEWAEKQLIF